MSEMPNFHASGHEPHQGGLAQRLNWLRAGVLGANDGIISVAAVVVGVAGTGAGIAPILAAGTAALAGGAFSMAVGEYVSVSSQRDSEHALIAKERHELETMPDEELEELAALYEARGVSSATARQLAIELTEHDALRAHLEAEIGIDPDDVVSPWHAAFASAVAFLCGGILPFLVILLVPGPARILATFVAVLAALVVTGTISARIGGSSKRRGTLRNVVGGAIALSATFAIGALLGTSGAV
ncbi:VIT1/CCC1 transporter family protein [Arthrobacter woluwensis]|uniref:VIT1/CCC1 transporter family protein n=1 Tax=Arthrobacter woluwensis TaxID=156980 RepID=UPI001AAFFC97|nr:VIT family protein [Arthrobacter woluwensis]QTF73419.1 VIT family protein [Arthrobacter woluwensis]